MADIDMPLAWRMQQDGYLMQINQLRDENAKLRELVDELYPLADYGAMDESELDKAHDLMRDVGIEVPA